MVRSTGSPVYERLGIKRVVNGISWRTNVGGSLMPTPVVEAMEQASRWFVDLDELNSKAGKIIAILPLKNYRLPNCLSFL